MEFEWDDAKNRANEIKHGVAFEAVAGFDWDGALAKRDDRRAYGEPRYTAVGHIGRRLHVLVFTFRGQSIRIISLRRANRREQRYYAEKKVAD